MSTYLIVFTLAFYNYFNSIPIVRIEMTTFTNTIATRKYESSIVHPMIMQGGMSSSEVPMLEKPVFNSHTPLFVCGNLDDFMLILINSSVGNKPMVSYVLLYKQHQHKACGR